MSTRHHASPPPGSEAGDGRVLRPTAGVASERIPRTAALADAWVALQTQRTTGRGPYLARMTTDNHRRMIRTWLRYLADVAQTDAPDAATVTAFRDWAGTTRQASTVNVLLDVIRLFYRWVQSTGQGADIAAAVDELPADGAADEPRIEQLTDEGVTTLLRTVAGDDEIARRTRAIIAVLRSCPVDTLALSRANRSAVDLDGGVIHLVRRWSISNHRRGSADGDLVESFPLTPTAQIYLNEYLAIRPAAKPPQPAAPARKAEPEPLFTSSRDGDRLSTLAMRLSVLRVLIAAGLRPVAVGVARHDIMNRYPEISPGDLTFLQPRLPADPDEADRLRALIHLLAGTDAAINWTRLQIGQVDTRQRCLQVVRGNRHGNSIQEHPLTEIQAAGIAPWLDRRRAAGAGAGDLVFCRDDGKATSHHTLKRWAWGLFPERLPPGTVSTTTHASTRLLRRGPGSETSRPRPDGRPAPRGGPGACDAPAAAPRPGTVRQMRIWDAFPEARPLEPTPGLERIPLSMILDPRST